MGNAACFFICCFPLQKYDQRVSNSMCSITPHASSLSSVCETILKLKNATGTSVNFHINNSLIHFVFVLTSVPNVGERFIKT